MSQTKSQLIEGSAASELTAAKTLLGAGSAGAPSLTATGDTNTGIFFPTADTIAFAEGGVETVRIDSSGRVGIGTTPAQLLHLSSGGFPTIRVTDADNSTYFDITNSDGDIILKADEGNTFANSAIRFMVDGGEKFRCDSSGRLLIGTSTARSNFNNTTDTTRLQIEGTDAATSSFSLVCNNGGGVPVASIHLAKSASGSIGSTTAVSNNWDLGDIRFSGSDGTEFVQAASIACEVDGTPGANDMPGRLIFSTTADGGSSPTERMRITQAGHVLIGCTSLPGGSTKGAGFYITGTDTEYLSSINTTASKNHIIFYNPNGAVGTIATNGSATAYNTSSDYRLKENVVPLTGAADRLSKLQVHRFNFIADPDTTVDGFLAHEAQAVVPECVTGTKDEVDNEDNPVYQGIDQSKLVPLLTAALQELVAEVESLKAEVAALKAP
jgi:hypothetical protein